MDDIGRVECIVAIEQRECPHRGTKPSMKSCYARLRKFLMNIYEFDVHITLASFAKRALARGDDPEEVIRRIADYRGDQKHANYARHTVTKAQIELQLGRVSQQPAWNSTVPASAQPGAVARNWKRSKAMRNESGTC